MKNRKAYNASPQYYHGVMLTLIVYTEEHFARLRAKRFMLGDPKYGQNVWIPNTFLEPDGTIKPDANLDWIFRTAYTQKKFEYARIQGNPYNW